MISIVIDLILLIILTEVFCILAKNPDIRVVFSMLHELEGMGEDAQSFADAYYAFLVQFMRIYQFFLKILISYKGITMMLLRGKTIGMLVNGIALVRRMKNIILPVCVIWEMLCLQRCYSMSSTACCISCLYFSFLGMIFMPPGSRGSVV